MRAEDFEVWLDEQINSLGEWSLPEGIDLFWAPKVVHRTGIYFRYQSLTGSKKDLIHIFGGDNTYLTSRTAGALKPVWQAAERKLKEDHQKEVYKKRDLFLQDFSG